MHLAEPLAVDLGPSHMTGGAQVLKRLVATLRRAVRLDDRARKRTRRAWQDWAEARPDERDKA